jgi:hypothetical protein
MTIEAFEIEELRATDTDELAIMHPVTGAATSWCWTLAGPAHPQTIAQSDRIARELMRRDSLRNQAIVNRKKWAEPEKTPEDQRRENAEFFADRVLGWTAARINGENYPFTRDNAVKLLLDPAYGRIYAQLSQYFQAEDSFTRRAATS